MGTEQLSASFRDPAGFLFKSGDKIYRQVNQAGKANYDLFMSSGLYETLASKRLIVSHKEVTHPAGVKPGANHYKTLLPKQIEFISYPYEWSFSQLKDAALLTLELQQRALSDGMILKDASAYNIQFDEGRPVLIDTLSFERYEGEPAWKAYRQFCQHFLAPLILMSQVDLRLGGLTRDYIDGIPLDLAAGLLPVRKKLKPGALLHIWMHSAAQKRYASTPAQTKVNIKAGGSNGSVRLRAQVDSLRRAILKLKFPGETQTEWGEYYSFTNYQESAAANKAKLLAGYIKQLKQPVVWDMGGNDGRFTRVALEAGARRGICFDIDPIAVEKNYLEVKRRGETSLLPLLFDLTNPSPSIGWANAERSSLLERTEKNTVVLALALVHHLAISNNLPLEHIAEHFSQLGKYLVIEFVPKEDSKVQILLSSREDIFPNYTQKGFEEAFGRYYKTLSRDSVKQSKRTLYLLERK